MKRKVFKYKAVYYLAISTTIMLMLISLFAFISLFTDSNFFKLLITLFTLIISLFSFVNLIEKYNKAVFYLNINLGVFAFFLGLKLFFTGISFQSKTFQFFIIIIIISTIINLYKIQNVDFGSEIDRIGKKED